MIDFRKISSVPRVCSQRRKFRTPTGKKLRRKFVAASIMIVHFRIGIQYIIDIL